MKPKSAIVGLLSLAAVGLTPQSASAMPNGLPSANHISNVEQVRWVCNPWGRCWWRPNYYRSTASTPSHASVIDIGAGTIAAGAGGNLPRGLRPPFFGVRAKSDPPDRLPS